MTIASLKIESNATAREEVLGAKDVRTLIAHQLGVDVKRVTDEAHFADDLGADWLDRLELMIEIEAQFPAGRPLCFLQRHRRSPIPPRR